MEKITAETIAISAVRCLFNCDPDITCGGFDPADAPWDTLGGINFTRSRFGDKEFIRQQAACNTAGIGLDMQFTGVRAV